ncbi:MAG: ribonuclease III [Synechococcaceae bacterium WB9_4xC_028]|jgi:ribonuclease-3|nr:ribonuclease III [Synechococcaceae bacterium WB9_4xC_028]
MPKALPHQRLQQLQQLLRRINIDTSGLASTGWAAVDEALTHTSAGLAINHEQLEFLGDAVLRLAASEYLEQHHPELSVGERSALRAQLVSDRWLAEVGEAIGISDALRIGPTAGGDATALSTMRAEATEALIGALYRAFGSLAPVHQWLTPNWERTSRAVLSDPHRGNCKSALQEWSQGQGLGLPQYSCREVSHRHGDPRRFHCSVTLPTDLSAEGWGGSRREAEQQAAASLLDQLVSC